MGMRISQQRAFMSLRVSTVLICFESAYIYMHAYIRAGLEVNTLLLIVIVLVAWIYSANLSHILI